jgi:nicotinamidase-related amidase
MRVAFPVLDAMSEGYDAYPVVDFTGGTSVDAHRAALARVVQAGARPPTWLSLSGELQRHWARQETMKDVSLIAPSERLLKE